MAAFINIYLQRDSFEDKFFKMLDDTRESRKIEYKAALTIQAAFHRFVFRKYYADLNQKATLIQKTFRMYRARILFKCLCVEQEQVQQEKYFNQMALIIQRAWRKYIADAHIVIPKSDGKPKVEHKVKIRKVIKKKRKKANQNFFF